LLAIQLTQASFDIELVITTSGTTGTNPGPGEVQYPGPVECKKKIYKLKK